LKKYPETIHFAASTNGCQEFRLDLRHEVLDPRDRAGHELRKKDDARDHGGQGRALLIYSFFGEVDQQTKNDIPMGNGSRVNKLIAAMSDRSEAAASRNKTWT
jgi:hypothetical protein